MYLIAGVDPGTTTGIAILNFKGELIDLFSSRTMGIELVVKHITGFGTASVIACDVTPVPQFVTKLSAILGAIIFKPSVSLSVIEKNNLTKNFDFKDPHQRDSLAAATNAFNKLKNKLMKIDAIDLNAFDLADDKKDEIKHRVIHDGNSLNSVINDLIKMREEQEMRNLNKEIESEMPGEKEKLESTPPEIRRIKELEDQNKTLRDEIKTRECEIEKLNDKILEIKGEYNIDLNRNKKIKEDGQIIQSFEYGMKDLQTRLNEKHEETDEFIELWRKLANGEIIPVGIFPARFNGISWIKRKFKKKDYKELNKIKILFISNPEEETELFERRIILCDEKYITEFKGCAYISPELLETAKGEAEETKYKLTKIDEGKLRGIIEEYRGERI